MLMLVVLLAGCQQSPSLVQRDGYYTWVDEQGQVRTTRVPASEQASRPLPRRQPEPAPAQAQTKAKAQVKAKAQPVQSDTGREPEAPAMADRAPEPGAVPSRSAAVSDEPPAPDDEYNLTNYPDAEALEAAGYIRPGDPLPYFTWRDASGQLQVSYYRPDTRSDEDRGREPLALTPGMVYQAGPSGAESEAATSASASPDAFLVLGIEPSGPDFFQRWRERCCRELPVEDVVSWSDSREFEVRVGDDASDYPFLSGPSRYRLVRLPEASRTASLVIRLRSFHNQGLFVPSVAFLDETMQPVRLVTDLVMEYTPESWHRQGYLQAMVPAFPARGERWLLVYTTPADRQGQTVVETARGPRAIAHQGRGLVSLTEMNP